MSFIPGFVDEVTKAVSGAASTVAKGANDAWNTLTGGITGAKSDEKNPLTKAPEDALSENISKPITEAPTVKDQEDWSKYSLPGLLAMLRMEAMHHCEQKAKIPYLKVKEAQAKSTELSTLLQTFSAHSDENGDLDVEGDEKTLELMRKAKEMGVVIADQKRFTKQERDSVIRNIDQTLKNLDYDMKIGFNDAQEALQQRNTFYQELKTCWDKLNEAIRRFIQALTGR